MKVTVYDIVSYKTALDRKKYCPKCGSHMLEVHQFYTNLDSDINWYIACEQCGHEGPEAPVYELAMLGWKNE